MTQWYQQLKSSRRYDPLTHRVALPDTMSRVSPRIFDNDGGLGVTGPHKLLQQVIAVMLTRSGGYLFEQTSNSFADNLLNNQIQNPEVFAQEFSIAVQHILDTLGRMNPRYYQLPPDEQIQTMELINIIVDAGVVVMTIDVVTNAGDAFRYIVPQQVIRD